MADWGTKKTYDFEDLQIQTKQDLAAQVAAKHQMQSYLFILVENIKVKPDEYLVDARIIPYIHSYNPITFDVSYLLINQITYRYTFKSIEFKILSQLYL